MVLTTQLSPARAEKNLAKGLQQLRSLQFSIYSPKRELLKDKLFVIRMMIKEGKIQ